MKDAIGYPLNCGKLNLNTNYIFKKPSIGGDTFRLLANPINRIIGAGTSTIDYQNDLVLVKNSGSTTITDHQISINALIPDLYDVTIYSKNSGVSLGPDQFNIASGVSSGSTSLIAISSDSSLSAVNIDVEENTPTEVIIFSGYVNNSLANHVSQSIDSRITNLDPQISKPIYATQSHDISTYIRNTDCWVSDLDLTAISPWNSTEGPNRAGTLVSPRHIIFAAHYQINNGSTIRFVDNNNNVITRTMINKLTHPLYSNLYPDITIGLLDEDVPESIAFVKILPQNWTDYLPTLANSPSVSYPIPCFSTDQNENAIVKEFWAMYHANSDNSRKIVIFGSFLNAVNINRWPFIEGIIIGDSGNPIFLIINDELVLISLWTTSSSGPNISFFKDDINQMMNSLGGGYQLQEIDLSNFLIY